MDNENEAYTQNRILFSFNKGNPAMCDSKDRTKGHYAK